MHRRGPLVVSALIWLALSACPSVRSGDDDDGNDGNDAGVPVATAVVGVKNGTRLRASTWDAGEGAAIRRGWHDSELEVDCTFQPAADGRYRCLPSVAFINSSLFLDSACVVPVAQAVSCDSVPRFALGNARAMPQCGDVRAVPVFNVDTTRTLATVFVDRFDGNGCREEPIESGFVAFELLDEVDPTTFVGAELAPLSTEPLAPYAFVADDGAVEASAIFDDNHGGECHARGSTDVTRCFPAERAEVFPQQFSDSACTTPIAERRSFRRACSLPSAVFNFRDQVHQQLGVELPPESLHRRDDSGNCALGSPSPDALYFDVGEIMPAESFAPLVETTDGSGRVVVHRLTDESGALEVTNEFPGVGFFDTERALPCHPVHTPDGDVCAAGNPALFGLYFADSECTQPVILGNDFDGPPLYALVRHRPSSTPPSCDPIEADGAIGVGARVEIATPFVLRNDGECTAANVPPEAIFFEGGDPITLPPLARVEG